MAKKVTISSLLNPVPEPMSYPLRAASWDLPAHADLSSVSTHSDLSSVSTHLDLSSVSVSVSAHAGLSVFYLPCPLSPLLTTFFQSASTANAPPSASLPVARFNLQTNLSLPIQTPLRPENDPQIPSQSSPNPNVQSPYFMPLQPLLLLPVMPLQLLSWSWFPSPSFSRQFQAWLLGRETL